MTTASPFLASRANDPRHLRRYRSQSSGTQTRPVMIGGPMVMVCLLLIAIALVGSAPAQALAYQDPPTTPAADPPPDDLGEKLIRGAVQDREEDVMARILRHMAEAARRLDMRFDPGEETQSTQRQALNLLDEAIAQAAARRRPQSSQGQSSHPDKRTAPDQTKPQKNQGKDAQAEGGASSKTGSREKGNAATGEAVGGRIKETRKSWGALPQRDRDEVIQGIEERFLERYRTLIEDYYRALQDEDDAP